MLVLLDNITFSISIIFHVLYLLSSLSLVFIVPFKCAAKHMMYKPPPFPLLKDKSGGAEESTSTP